MAIQSLADFLEDLRAFLPLPGGLRAFRGSRNYKWDLLPGILRPRHGNLLKFERDAVREMLSVRSADFLSDNTMFDRLVRMQHFDLPTRLLDVTANPLVALYFATDEVDGRLESPEDGVVDIVIVPQERKKYFDSDTVSCVANIANLSDLEKKALAEAPPSDPEAFHDRPEVDRLYQFIRAEKPFFRPCIRREDLDRIWYVVPKLSNARIIAQSGAFLLYGLTPPKIGGSAYIDITQLLVDKSCKKFIRKELGDLGINQRTLFPEIDKAAFFIIKQFA